MIFTIDAKGNILFSAMQKFLGLGSADLNREIKYLHDDLVKILEEKGIKYQELKNALIPNKDRKEALLIFDSSKTNNSFYGGVIMDQVLMCLKDLKTHSVLTGDFIDIVHNPNFNVLNIMKDYIELPVHSRYCAEFYLVYINNLSERQFNYVDNFYNHLEYFVGCVDVTYTSTLKDYSSHILGTSFIKYKNIIISMHEDDRDVHEDINIKGYPFEKYGYKIRSLPEYLFGVFLNYKIESNITGADISDVGVSIQSISHEYDGLNGFQVFVDEHKLNYLKENKLGTLKKFGGVDLTRKELENIILSHIKYSCVFNLDYASKYDVSKFNIIFEVEDIYGKPNKVIVALEYMYSEKQLRLLTLF